MWAKKLRNLLDKMVGSNQTLIALRMVRSKLRKREESNNNSHNQSSRNPGHGRLHGGVVHPQDNAKCSSNGQSHLLNGVGHAVMEAVTVNATTTSPATAIVIPANGGVEDDAPQEKNAPLELFLWSYPTTRSSCGTQLSLYSGDQDTLVNALPCEEPRESKGVRKNLRGTWKRLIKKKQPVPDVCSIPPELRDQLKQIYVY